MGHKMLQSTQRIEEIIIQDKIKDNLVAYYTDTDKSQLNRNIQSSSVVD